MLSPKWSVDYRSSDMELPVNGMRASDVESHLASRRSHDVRWNAGRVFSLVYSAGPDVDALSKRVLGYSLFAFALNVVFFAGASTAFLLLLRGAREQRTLLQGGE